MSLCIDKIYIKNRQKNRAMKKFTSSFFIVAVI